MFKLSEQLVQMGSGIVSGDGDGEGSHDFIINDLDRREIRNNVKERFLHIMA